MTKNHIFINGKIFTSDDENLWTEAMIVRDGRIFWTGRMENLPDCEGTVTDLEGKCIIPGIRRCTYASGHAGRFS